MAKDATADFATAVSHSHLMFVRATNRSLFNKCFMSITYGFSKISQCILDTLHGRVHGKGGYSLFHHSHEPVMPDVN
jgi:hypothetical protein